MTTLKNIKNKAEITNLSLVLDKLLNMSIMEGIEFVLGILHGVPELMKITSGTVS